MRKNNIIPFIIGVAAVMALLSPATAEASETSQTNGAIIGAVRDYGLQIQHSYSTNTRALGRTFIE
ncbi:hypothetical protein [Bifidobacterium fermentum]|uniref:Uncharacterized protein n=1 Tax=Bifidobacterium fermentum TaxID=3059035 RepID=A0AB39UD65_9BIFI